MVARERLFDFAENECTRRLRSLRTERSWALQGYYFTLQSTLWQGVCNVVFDASKQFHEGVVP